MPVNAHPCTLCGANRNGEANRFRRDNQNLYLCNNCTTKTRQRRCFHLTPCIRCGGERTLGPPKIITCNGRNGAACDSCFRMRRMPPTLRAIMDKKLAITQNQEVRVRA